MPKRLALFMLAGVLCGCMAHGREIHYEQLAQLKQGETTVDQAIYLLGQPYQRMRLSTGQERLMYYYMSVQSRPENFIPIVGPLTGGHDVYRSSAILYFDRNGVLQRYISSEGGSAITVNAASGSIRKRQEDPAEAPPREEEKKPDGLPMAIPKSD